MSGWRAGATWIGITVTVIAMAAALFNLRYPTHRYRYRLTIAATADGQLRVGSSVIEVRVSKKPQFLPEVLPFSYSSRGEAVFVDLGRGRNLVGLLASGPFGQSPSYPELVVTRHLKIPVSDDQQMASLASRQGIWQLDLSELPTLVSFDDVNDPNSGRIVRPEDIGSVFGPGVSLRSATIEIVPAGYWPLTLIGPTGEPIRYELTKRLPFLVSQKEELWHVIYNLPPRFQPSIGAFER
jgi:hypothetical protein